jgi:hypothetical protein
MSATQLARLVIQGLSAQSDSNCADCDSPVDLVEVLAVVETGGSVTFAFCRACLADLFADETNLQLLAEHAWMYVLANGQIGGHA